MTNFRRGGEGHYGECGRRGRAVSYMQSTFWTRPTELDASKSNPRLPEAASLDCSVNLFSKGSQIDHLFAMIQPDKSHVVCLDFSKIFGCAKTVEPQIALSMRNTASEGVLRETQSATPHSRHNTVKNARQQNET